MINLEKDVQQAISALRKLEYTINEGLSGTLHEAAENILVDIRERFRRQVDTEGNAWKPSMTSQSIGYDTLYDSGALFSSMRYATDELGISIFAGGSKAPYAKVHQYGATINAKIKPFLCFVVGGKFVKKVSVTIPKREFVGVSHEDMAKIKLNLLTRMGLH